MLSAIILQNYFGVQVVSVTTQHTPIEGLMVLTWCLGLFGG